MFNKLINTNAGGGGGGFPAFNTVIYTADGTVTSIDVGFQPDLVWIKGMTLGASNQLTDSVRTAPKAVKSNRTDSEDLEGVASFNSNGFTLQAFPNENGDSNTSGQDYVAWCWKAGGAAVLDTSGDLDAYVSANQEAGFSIIKPSVQTNVNQTIPHGLTQAPDLIILKTTDVAQNWFVSAPTTSGLTPDTRRYGVLNTIDAFTNGGTNAGTGYAPTVNSTFIITPGVAGVSNYDYWFGKTNIIYAFHSVAGFSKIGSYAGTGAAGNFQDCGFEPAFIMIKITNITSSWFIWDNKRSPSNPRINILEADDSAAAYNSAGPNFLPTGFDFDSGSYNNSGLNFLYIAFANQF